MPRTAWHLLLSALMALVASAQAFSAPPFLVRLFGAVACDQSLMLSAVALDLETGRSLGLSGVIDSITAPVVDNF